MPLTSLPGIIQFAKSPFSRHFHRAQNRHGDFTATDHAKGLRAVEIGGLRQFGDRLFARIDQVGVFVALDREMDPCPACHSRTATSLRSPRGYSWAPMSGMPIPRFTYHRLAAQGGACRHLIAIPSHFSSFCPLGPCLSIRPVSIVRSDRHGRRVCISGKDHAHRGRDAVLGYCAQVRFVKGTFCGPDW